MIDTPLLLGIDLGKQTDHTALVLAEPSGDEYRPVYDLTWIERVPLKTRYTTVVEHAKALVETLRQAESIEVVSPLGAPVTIERRPDLTLILDYTGVGMAVAEMFLDADIDCDLILVSITGGTKVTRDEDTGTFYVPKGDLVSAIQRTLQEERLRLPADDPHTPLLTKEMAEFQAKIGTTGHISFGVVSDWRVGQHDDLVLAAALALWFGESRRAVEVW